MRLDLENNLSDAAIGGASDRLLGLLNMIGQDEERGYRNVFSTLWDAHPVSGFSSPNRTIAEQCVEVLNVVVFSVDVLNKTAAEHKRFSDDKLADLLCFFVQRMKFAPRILRPYHN